MGMGGSDGCRNDILLIAWEYVTWLLLRTSIRRDISSPSTSVNDPRLAIYGCMCVGVHTWTHTEIYGSDE